VSAPEPYFSDGQVSLYLGDCREVTAWLDADVLVTDPPYGRGWRQGGNLRSSRGRPSVSRAHGGIAGDLDTSVRDDALRLWGDRCAAVFGDLMLAPPVGTRQVCVYRKAQDAGSRGATGGFRRDLEAVYLVGPWPSGIGGRSSLLATRAPIQGGEHGVAARCGHPHAKPGDVMEELIAACPPGVIADPFAGSCSTLVAARNLGRKAVGIEVDEEACERAARRLSQMTLTWEAS